MGFLSSIASSIAGPLVGGVLGIGSTALANRAERKEAQRSRDWQEEMSNTSIQRRVADLRLAGLNPLLAVSSASSGASTPTGATAGVHKFDPSFIEAMTSAYMAKKQGELVDAQRDNVNASTKNIEADTVNKNNDASLFEIRKEGMALDNMIKKYKIITEGLQQRILSTTDKKLQLEMIGQAFKNRNIDLDNQQKEAVLIVMQNEAQSFANSSTAKTIEWGVEQSTKVLGSISGVISAISDVFMPHMTVTSQSNNKKTGVTTTISKTSRR